MDDFSCCGGNDDTPKEHTQDCERLMIKVWAFADAPDQYTMMSGNGGDEDFVAFVPTEYIKKYGHEPYWLEEGGRFGICSVDKHEVPGGFIFIGSHA